MIFKHQMFLVLIVLFSFLDWHFKLIFFTFINKNIFGVGYLMEEKIHTIQF